MIIEIKHNGDTYYRYPVFKDKPNTYHWRGKNKSELRESHYESGFDGVIRYFQRAHFKGTVKFITDKPFRKEDWL